MPQCWHSDNTTVTHVSQIASVAKFTALLPRLTSTFCHIYFSYRMAQHGSNPQRDSASFTMVPSSQTPATKTQKTWTVVCSHPHDCKILELRSALFFPPMFQLTAESCSGICLSCRNHISSSSQTELLY